MTKPKCKACHNKTCCASTLEKMHMHGANESRNLIMKLSNAHRRVGRRASKAKLLQNARFRKKSFATPHRLLTNKPASTEWGIHSSPTWMIAWPPNFNKAFIASILTVLPCICWGGDLESPRLMEASSSSLLHLPSCGESIQTGRSSTQLQLEKRSCSHRQQRVLLAKYVYLRRCNG